MSTLSLAAAGLRGHARRLAATALAIVLSVGFVATTLLALDAMERGIGETVAGDVVNRDLVLWSGEAPLGAGEVDALRERDGLSVVAAPAQVYGTVDSTGVLATTTPTGPGVELLEGKLPAGPDQVVASSTTDHALGDTVTLEPYDSSGEAGDPVDLDVVGIMDVGDSPLYTWQDVLVAQESALREWDPELGYAMVTIDLAGIDEAGARAAVAEAAPGVEVMTGPEAANRLISQATGGLDLLGPVLLGFGAIAVATSALVIANTFAIVLAQRTRELALLRCVGATRAQVRRTVLLEALTLGVVASAAGVLLGVAITWTAALTLGEVNLGTPVTLRPGWNPVSLLAPLVAGVAVTLAAAWWPTRRATRVAPMAALQPAVAPAVASRPGLLRIVASVLLLGAGAAGLVLAAMTHNVLVGVASGLLSFVGVLVAAVFFVPAGIRTLGALLRGVPSRLAVGNTVSNPGRAAATSAALLIGVTLITMTSVGAASAERTALSEIDEQFPADVMAFPQFELVGNPSDEDGERMTVRPLDEAIATQVDSVPGVAETVQFEGGWLQMEQADGTWAESPVYGIDPAVVAPVLRDPQAVQRLEPGTVGLSDYLMEIRGLREGDTLVLTGPDGSSEATVVPFPLDEVVLPSADLVALDASSAAGGGLLIRLSDDAEVSTVVSAIRDLVEPEGAWVTGSASERAQLTTMLDVLVLITTALLGVAVVIAVVGIANTLALSVLERTRENALLRALGLTRSQLRGMLTLEGVLLSVVSALLGIVLGVTYAWFGVQTLLPEGTTTQLAFPVTQLAVILALAIVAGLLASVLPARRAARIAPAAGLATV
ncbi:ABC transporter permease [Ornithinimicrobium faecis]|uniref:ABC transporter permease n=1 Tax=Ornithinimicrobium faecis TaxID=2934158 RepID=UPI002118C95F|nr:FtsX-like permease family protein [Ornithinimicrobium sp. HY1745]